MPVEIDGEKYLTMDEVSQILGRAKQTLYNWSARGEGPPKKPGVNLYPERGLRAYLERDLVGDPRLIPPTPPETPARPRPIGRRAATMRRAKAATEPKG